MELEWSEQGRRVAGQEPWNLWESSSKLRTGPSMKGLELHPNPQWIITLYKNAFNLQTILLAKLVYCFTLKYKTALLFHTFWQCKTTKFLLLNGPFQSCLSISTNHTEVHKDLHLFYKPFNTKRLTEYYWPIMLADVFSRRQGLPVKDK